MNNKLSPMEYKFMELIWKHPEGIYSSDIYDAFPQALGTKGAILHRIKEKEFVTVQQIGKKTLYIPSIQKREYDKMAIQMRLKKTFGSNSLDSLIAALCGKEQLSKVQEDKLYDLIEELSKEEP